MVLEERDSCITRRFLEPNLALNREQTVLSFPVLFEHFVRPYLVGNFASCLSGEVRHRQVWSVLGWVSTCEHLMMLMVSYQSKWSVYRRWDAKIGHSVSHPTGSEMADYLLWLWESRKFSVSLVKARCTMLSEVFRFKLLELWGHHVLSDLTRSFGIERPLHPQLPSSLDLDVLLCHLVSATYEPLESLSFFFGPSS